MTPQAERAPALPKKNMIKKIKIKKNWEKLRKNWEKLRKKKIRKLGRCMYILACPIQPSVHISNS